MNPKMPAARAATTFAPGELVLGRFRIVRLLGSGGMGEVYEATDLELGRIALKTLRADFGSSAEVLSRFKKEVQLARKAGGPHICRVHELFVTPGRLAGIPSVFLTMEYLEGVTLADRIAASGPMTWKEAQAIGLEICAGLETIHRAGIIHRDLKSRNVMLASRNGATCAVLMDFGLAREFASAATAETSTFATRPGGIVGTPAYMAPEQFEGAEVTPATDIYALGIVLYEILTGEHPFAASTTEGAAVARGRRPKPVSVIRPEVPKHFDEVIEKCLAYEPGSRYQSARELAEALGAYPLSTRELIEKRLAGRHRWGIFVGVCGILLLIVVGGLLWVRAHSYHQPSEEVRKWYDRGIANLREGSYLKAKGEFEAAIERDKGFVLAYARLADAWNELGFEKRAADAMLLAMGSEAERNLPELDRMYVEAVHSTLTRDFATAVTRYKAILEALPEKEKTYGYVDLGRAQEKAGKMNEALKNYEEATKVDKDNPIAFVRLGVLRNRQQDTTGGESAFQQAESLYRVTMDQEGLAEIAYQRGYAENERGESDSARKNLQASRTAAQQMGDVQLEIRDLTQLSSVEYNAGNGEKAVEYANEAIQLARGYGLEYWSGDGQMRLGNAYLSLGKLDAAESPLQEALRLAHQDQQPRLEANASSSLASLRDQQGKPDEAIRFAEVARDYYKGVGMVDASTSVSILIVRGQVNKKDFAAALQSATGLLEVSRKSANSALIESSEELMGGVLNALERYPEALSHYEEAFRIARSIHENEPFYALHCAEVLWPLGRYNEAQNMLLIAHSGKNVRIASAVELLKTTILLSQERFAVVIAHVDRSFSSKGSDAAPDDLPQFRLLRARAEARLGRVKEASEDMSALAEWVQKEGDEEMAHNIKLLQAEAYRKASSPELAEPLASAAYLYFLRLGKKESQWLSLLEQARIQRGLGKVKESQESAKSALDILGEFEQTWPPADYRSYTSRPDNMAALRELTTYEGK